MDTAAAESNNHLPMLLGSEFGATIQVEVCQNRTSAARAEDVKMHVMNLLQRHPVIYGDYTWSKFDNEFLQKHVASVAVVDTEMHLVDSKAVDLLNSHLQLHVFQLWEDGPTTELLEQDNEALAAASHWLLPAAEFQGLWENLVYDNEIKSHLLQYITTTILFSDMKVDSNIISWNRVVLLHGPPGTGKTSLCKALAQKLSIRLSGRYKFGQLIEINSHSLFSKWFSESGKLVMKMFQKIQDLIDDKESLICVLIDEVESLTASRSASLASTEPSDAIRVVNALLTQIDQIKRYSNVIILTTSNVTGKIDMAFVDRADIKQYIGPPSAAAIFKIYLSGLEELMKCHIIHPRQQLLNLRQLERMNFVTSKVSHLSLQLRDIANKSQGLSGRTLRKIPFLAHALFVQESPVTLECFLECLSKTVDRQFCENDNFISPH